jgi:hypothetical protein
MVLLTVTINIGPTAGLWSHNVLLLSYLYLQVPAGFPCYSVFRKPLSLSRILVTWLAPLTSQSRHNQHLPVISLSLVWNSLFGLLFSKTLQSIFSAQYDRPTCTYIYLSAVYSTTLPVTNYCAASNDWQVYTVKYNTSNINKNTLHWRHVSAHIVAIFRP